MKKLSLIALLAISITACSPIKAQKSAATPTPILIHEDNGAWSACVGEIKKSFPEAEFAPVESANIVLEHDKSGAVISSYTYNGKNMPFACGFDSNNKVTVIVAGNKGEKDTVLIVGRSK